MESVSLNVYGQPIEGCSKDPMTGFYRDGFCKTGEEDMGTHVICARMTEEFLLFSKSRGNDLITPKPQWRFPGLKPGDQWCLCALRWREAWEAGVAPPVCLHCTNIKALDYVPLEVLEMYAIR
jgi:uncharacterized protein (DUF2237 family)